MAFTLPNFNLTLDWWVYGNLPSLGPPDIGGVPAQLYVDTRTLFVVPKAGGVDAIFVEWMRIQNVWPFVFPPPYVGSVFGWTDPAGNQWYYLVKSWEWAHVGFPNEYLDMLVMQCDNAGDQTINNR